MALSEESSGTQTATISTEHSLAAPTTANVRILVVDTNAMANGDVLELRIKQKVLSGGTERVAFYAAFANVQFEPILISLPVAQFRGGTFTLTQTAGTGRAFPWQILTTL